MSAVASMSRFARVSRVASSIMSFISKASFCLGANTDGVCLRRNSFRASASSSLHSIGECGLDLWTGVQRTQHNDRSDGGAGKFRCDVGPDSGEAQYVDLQHLPGATRLLEILAAIIPQPEV